MKRLDTHRDAWFLELIQTLPALAWVKDAQGRYVFVNKLGAEAFGKTENEILGRTDLEIFPERIADNFRRNDAEALKKGSAMQTIEALPDREGILRYSLVTKFPVRAGDGETYVAGTAMDITDQRTADTHQEFLSRIGETIRISRDGDQLLEDTADALGKFLGVDRCLFNEIDLSRDIETVRSEFKTTGDSVIGSHRLSAYSPATRTSMEQGSTVVNRDSQLDSRTEPFFDTVYGPAGERAYVAVPMMREGQWVGSLWCSSRNARGWTEQEVQLIETVAERTWAAVERLRGEKVLKGSHDTFLALIKSAPFGLYLVDSNFRLAEISLGSEKVFSNIEPLIGRDFEEILRIVWPEPFATEAIGIFRHTLETGEPYHSAQTTEQRGNQPVVESYDWQVKRVTMPDGSFGVVCYFYDLTELNEAQAASRRAALADAFRVRLADRLRLLSDATEIQSAAAEVIVEELGADRVAYFEILDSHYVVETDSARGVEHLKGQYPIESFGEHLLDTLRSGVNLVSDDVTRDPRLSDDERSAFNALTVGAFVCVPLVKNGEVSAGLTVHSRVPRSWSPDEITMIEEAGERIRDAVQRAQAETAQRESEARFRNMADQAPMMVWVTDANGSCTYLSQSWYEFTGQTSATGLGSGFVRAIHEDDRETDVAKFRQAVEDHLPFYSEHRLRRCDGTYEWMICSANPRFAASGEFLGHIGSVLEITDRKRAEERLRQSHDLNQSVLDSMPSHLAVLDQNGTITSVNRAWMEFAKDNSSNWTFERVGVGADYLEVCDRAKAEGDSDAQAIGDGIRDVLKRRRESFALEYPRHSPTEDRWFLLTVFPLMGGGAVISHQNITERRKVEQELRNAAERFSLAQTAGNVGIWDWNASTNRTYWSDQMWKFYGVERRDESPGDNFWPDHLYQEDRERILRRVDEILAGSETEFRDEYRIVREDGQIRWLSTSATVERDDDGKPTRMYGVNIDITDRKSTEERIFGSEQQLRLITDSLPALVSYISRDRKYEFVNRRYTQWFGRQPEEILGRSMRDVLGEAVENQIRPNIDKVLSGELVDFETWLDYKGAGRKYVRVSYVPDLSRDGAIAGFYALVSDLTEQRRSEKLLRSAEERMKALTESFTDYAILSTDTQGIIDSWNPGARNIFGFSEKDILGTSARKLFTPEDVAAGVPEQEMKNAQEVGRAADERWHVRKDGSRFFASGVMAPLYTDGQLTGFAKIARDLTEKRRQAEELQQAYEELENRVLERTRELAEANESLLEQINERHSAERQRIHLLQRIVTTQEVERRRIALDIHDHLGQRLTALRLKIASLSELCSDDDRLRTRATRLQQIAELLDSEVSFLTWQLRPSALDELGLAAALETFVREWSRHYNKPAEFHVEGLRGIRLSSEAETHIYRITQEALNNISKHAEANSVSVLLERVGELLILIVEDDGFGFDPERLERSVGNKHGMGLPGMQERAELIGGQIEIESARGSGTTIYLRIPIEKQSLEGPMV